jgi:anthranilate 1,2-dioxygenase large subunit
MAEQAIHSPSPSTWRDTLTRVPYSVFQADETYCQEQQCIFRDPLWHFLCLERKIRNGDDFKTTSVGNTPVVVSRDYNGEIHAFENRCAHRGALICMFSQEVPPIEVAGK